MLDLFTRSSFLSYSLFRFVLDSMSLGVALTFYILLNYVSSVSILAVNKVLFSRGFHYGTLLTVIHFVFTFVSLWIASRWKMVTPKTLNWSKVLPLSATYSGFVAVSNISLVFNPISITQLLKVLTIPLVIIVEYILYKKVYPPKCLIALGICCFGVLLTSLKDFRTTTIGATVGFIGVLVAVLNQIFVGEKQKELNCNAVQLLLYQAPVSALLLVPAIPILDYGIVSDFVWPSSHIAELIILSCICAVGVNCSIFLLIGKTSPVTYNIVSNAKLVSQLLIDFLFFNGEANAQIILGCILTLIGVSWYSHLKIKDQEMMKKKMLQQ
eukprot:gene12471-8553_t